MTIEELKSVKDFLFLKEENVWINPNADSELNRILTKNPDIDILYCDEKWIFPETSQQEIWRKPDWSEETFLSQNVFGACVVIRTSLFNAISEDNKIENLYEICLIGSELGAKIFHVSECLYLIEKKDRSLCTGENNEGDSHYQIIKNTLKRRKINGELSFGKTKDTILIHYYTIGRPKVSIIIPTKDHPDDFKKCIDSIIEKTIYENWEILVVDNDSSDQACFELYESYKKKLSSEKFKVISMNRPFNFSQMNNEAAKHAKGEYLVLMNNDIELLSEGWMTEMLGYAQQNHIGAVGAKLYYPDNTIQHAGIVMGIGGMAGHSHKGMHRDETGYFDRLSIPCNYAAVTAALLMVDKKKYFEVDGLNEIDLKVSFNDVDFCLKLLTKGYQNIVLPQVEAYHYESKSRGFDESFKDRQRLEREAEYIRQHWDQYIKNDPYYNPHLTRRREDFSEKDKIEDNYLYKKLKEIKLYQRKKKYLCGSTKN